MLRRKGESLNFLSMKTSLNLWPTSAHDRAVMKRHFDKVPRVKTHLKVNSRSVIKQRADSESKLQAPQVFLTKLGSLRLIGSQCFLT